MFTKMKTSAEPKPETLRSQVLTKQKQSGRPDKLSSQKLNNFASFQPKTSSGQMKYQPNSVNVSDFKKNHRVEAPKSSKQEKHLNPKRMLSADESPRSKHFSGIGMLDMVSQSQSAANYDILSKEEEDQMMLEIDEISVGGGDDGNQSGIHSMSNNSIFMLNKSP